MGVDQQCKLAACQTIHATIFGLRLPRGFQASRLANMNTSRLLTIALALAFLLTSNAAFAANEEYELIVWNQHNGTAKDRGTKAIRVEVFNGGSVLWKTDRMEIEWSADADTKVAVKIPKQNFAIDRVRVTVLEWYAGGGGLAELELMRGGENIAPKCAVAVSAFLQNDQRFGAKRLTDHITSSKDFTVGYWLLPNEKSGWAELKLPK